MEVHPVRFTERDDVDGSVADQVANGHVLAPRRLGGDFGHRRAQGQSLLRSELAFDVADALAQLVSLPLDRQQRRQVARIGRFALRRGEEEGQPLDRQRGQRTGDVRRALVGQLHGDPEFHAVFRGSGRQLADQRHRGAACVPDDHRHAVGPAGRAIGDLSLGGLTASVRSLLPPGVGR